MKSSKNRLVKWQGLRPLELAVASRKLSKTLAFHMENWPKKSRMAFGVQHSSFISHRGVITEKGLLFPKLSVYLYPSFAS